MDGIIWWVVGIIFIFMLIGFVIAIAGVMNIDIQNFDDDDDDEPY